MARMPRVLCCVFGVVAKAHLAVSPPIAPPMRPPTPAVGSAVAGAPHAGLSGSSVSGVGVRAPRTPGLRGPRISASASAQASVSARPNDRKNVEADLLGALSANSLSDATLSRDAEMIGFEASSRASVANNLASKTNNGETKSHHSRSSGVVAFLVLCLAIVVAAGARFEWRRAITSAAARTHHDALYHLHNGLELASRERAASLAVAAMASENAESSGRIRLHHQSGASCEISTFGAHVLSWEPEPGDERLFLGSMAQIGVPGVSIRGGVPLCWPQFGMFTEASKPPGLPHGFARKSQKWQVSKQGEDFVTLMLVDDEETRATWPFSFQFLYKISLGEKSLRFSMEVANHSQEAMEFTGCLHTYWSCQSSHRCHVEGLQGASFDKYIGDSFRGDATEDRAAVTFSDEKETQLLYTKTSDVVTLVEDGGRSLRLTKSNMPDWVLWNTGAENGSNIKDLDMENKEYQRYVCVEPGFTSKPIHVAPGTTWVASHEAEAL